MARILKVLFTVFAAIWMLATQGCGFGTINPNGSPSPGQAGSCCDEPAESPCPEGDPSCNPPEEDDFDHDAKSPSD